MTKSHFIVSRLKKLPITLAALSGFALSVPTLHSAVLVWAGTISGSKTDWNTKGDWAPASANGGPTSSDTTSFDGTSNQASSTLSAASQALGVTFSGSMGYTISSPSFSLSIGTGGVVNSATAVETISAPIILVGAAPFTDNGTGAGALTISGTVANGGFLLTLNGTGTSGTVSNVISGTGGLTKSGTGTWTLSGANTYTGTTTVSAGSLNVTGSLSSSTALQVNGGTITFTPASQTVSALSGTGGTVAFTAGAHTLTIAQASNTSYAGAITGASAGLTKSGAGTLTLTGSSNSYGGATTISAGTFKVNGSITGTGAVSVASGATLAGTGSLAGATTLNSGGFLSPGDAGSGSLSLPSLTFNGGGTINVGLGSGSTVAIAGAFTQGSAGTYTINFGNTGTAGNTYTLATFGSTTFNSGGDFTFANLAPGLGGSFALSGVDLTFITTAIPEPSTYAAILGIGALGFVIYRRRQARSTLAVTTEV